MCDGARRTPPLDAAALELDESRSALADRLLGDAVRLERHPPDRLPVGRGGTAHPRRRRYQARRAPDDRDAAGDHGDVDATADHLALAPALVGAALAYYADFRDEVDTHADAAASAAREERGRWERGRQALG